MGRAVPFHRIVLEDEIAKWKGFHRIDRSISPCRSNEPIDLIARIRPKNLRQSRIGRSKSRFAVGHMALGYLLSRASARALKADLNLPIALTLSVIPDIDILIPFLEHRGPTHSITLALATFIPVLAIYKKGAVPYLLALVQHSVIGDYLIGGQTQLLWPMATPSYGLNVCILSLTNLALEWTLFLASMAVMAKTEDAAFFLRPHRSNLILSIPTFTVLLPTFFGYPLAVPLWLMPPHLVYVAIFAASMVGDLYETLKKAR